MDDVEAAVIAAAEAHLRACQLGDLLPRPDDCRPCYLHRALPGTLCAGCGCRPRAAVHASTPPCCRPTVRLWTATRHRG